MDIINSLKNSVLLVLLFLLPLHINLESMKIFIYPVLLICFGVVYFISYIMSGAILQLLGNASVLLAGIFLAPAIIMIFYTKDLYIFLTLTAMLSLGSAIIDYSRSGHGVNETRSYLYSGSIIGLVFLAEHYIALRIIYVFYIMAVLIIAFSLAFYLSGHMEINYRKTTLIKKLKRYIISLSDIKRIRNGWTLLYAIMINVVLFISIAIVLLTVPVLALSNGGITTIYIFLGIASLSFLAISLGSAINSRVFSGISFVAVFPFLLVMGFLISIKNTEFNLTTGFLMFPAVALFFPGYRKYFTRKFPGSEIYYANKFANFFSWVFILPMPFILLEFLHIPVYTVIIELIASMAGLIMVLKFTNYPEIIWTKKHKN